MSKTSSPNLKYKKKKGKGNNNKNKNINKNKETIYKKEKENDQQEEPIKAGFFKRLLIPGGLYDKESPAKYQRLVTNPLSILVMLAICTYMIYLAFMNVPSERPLRIIRGFFCGCIIVIMYGALSFKDTALLRPHPIYWRIGKAVGLLYMTLMLFLLFQKPEETRKLFTHLFSYPGIGEPFQNSRNYAGDCRIYTPELPNKFNNVYEATYDIFIVAHFVGWMWKAFLLRERVMCWITGIIFEILEITLVHQLPNFGECWWDHLILDLFGCNWLGIELGMYIIKKFKIKEFHWFGRVNPEKKVKTKWLPKCWQQYQWELFESPKRFGWVMFIVFFMSVVDLMAFYWKTTLYLPTQCAVNGLRLLIWWIVGPFGLREAHDYALKESKSLGDGTLIGIGMLFSEILLAYKCSEGLFTNPMPNNIKYPWMVFLSLWFGGALIYFAFIWKKKKIQKKQN
ncbi:phosphatidylserine synthase 2 [Anaeramoeba flamelloides]|uniref:Phosphatidylserine synthase 2 n=1 Tax=Anaeramoeba flamelloides TaxID=1746091 RepID=A0ABQ8Z579_9EUKA|nr:phosphatidylserine synthase 2 [Anaeramoeba flamelloides]|eukprot:Anaeramoba_flamelloidesa1056035_333.p1 GENE.a1056035_333~~a1056035_333.p1  ORF type:complete len:454 (+),score=96.27 a1056035_333:19-1380(+)